MSLTTSASAATFYSLYTFEAFAEEEKPMSRKRELAIRMFNRPMMEDFAAEYVFGVRIDQYERGVLKAFAAVDFVFAANGDEMTSERSKAAGCAVNNVSRPTCHKHYARLIDRSYSAGNRSREPA